MKLITVSLISERNCLQVLQSSPLKAQNISLSFTRAKSAESLPLKCLWQQQKQQQTNSKSSPPAKTNAKPKKSNQQVLNLSEMPGPSPSLPLIGTGWQYWPLVGKYNLFNLHDAMKEKHDKYGVIYKEEYQPGKAIVYLSDPADFETVFRAQGKCPMRPPNEFVRHYRQNRREKYPNVGMAHMVGEEWYNMRQMIAPVLMKPEIVNDYVDDQNELCQDFVKFIEQKQGKILEKRVWEDSL